MVVIAIAGEFGIIKQMEVEKFQKKQRKIFRTFI